MAIGFSGKVNVDLIALLAIQVLYAIASLALISVGLTVSTGRAELVGYDPRAYKLATFIIAGTVVDRNETGRRTEAALSLSASSNRPATYPQTPRLGVY